MEISSLLVIAGLTLLVSFLWAASVAFTFWDARRRNLPGIELLVWVGLAILLPFIGLGLYLFSRVLLRLFSPGNELLREGERRSTAPKRRPETGRAMPTYLAAEMVKDTIADPGLNPFPQASRSTGGLKFHCFVLEGPCRGKEFHVDALPARIGRGPEAAIRLDQDLGVSRRHAEVYERDGMLWIRDLNSTHGTLVNGVNIGEVSLEAGDRIQVGLSVLQFERLVDKKGPS